MRKLLITAGLMASVGMGALPLRVRAANTLPPSSNGSFSYAAVVATPGGSYSRATAVSASAIVQYALKFLGYPYTATGNSPSTGFSCIGFVSYVYRSNGINLPGDLGGALAFAPRVAFSNLLPGDILYFQNTVWAGLSHAAIYIGGGRFVHAEWYNRGVVTSSFTNDPVDGNYWTAHYLGANRPWTGSAGTVATPAPSVQRTGVVRITPVARATVAFGSAPTPVPTAVAVPTTSSAPARAAVQLPTGPIALVRVPSLNVRSGPSIRASIYTVIRHGTKLVVLGQQTGWFRVSLPNGGVGWVIGLGIGKGGNDGGYEAGPDQRDHIILATPTSIPTATRQPVAVRAVARKRIGVAMARPARETVTVHVPAVRVHSAPSLTAAVLGMATPSRRLTVLGHTLQWVKVRLPDRTVGWISRQYAHLPVTRTHVSTGVSGVRGTRTASRARVALNVRAQSSRSSAIVAVVVPGGAYHILRWSHGWAQVRLTTGTSGWISGSVLTAAFATTSPATSRASSPTAARSSVTANVRVHVRPSLNSAAIRLLKAGTQVRVLGVTAGWSKVRLSVRQTGYILGAYVQQ